MICSNTMSFTPTELSALLADGKCPDLWSQHKFTDSTSQRYNEVVSQISLPHKKSKHHIHMEPQSSNNIPHQTAAAHDFEYYAGRKTNQTFSR